MADKQDLYQMAVVQLVSSRLACYTVKAQKLAWLPVDARCVIVEASRAPCDDVFGLEVV